MCGKKRGTKEIVGGEIKRLRQYQGRSTQGNA